MKRLIAPLLLFFALGATATPVEEVVDVELIHVSIIIPEKKQPQPGLFVICSATFSAKGGGVLTTVYGDDLPQDPNYLLFLMDTAIWMGDSLYITVDVMNQCPEGGTDT
jgi:hypothetical protein